MRCDEMRCDAMRCEAKKVNGPTLPRSKVGRVGHPENQGQNRAELRVGHPPIPAGSFVTHFGKQIHYDGAKDSEAVLEIVGDGPATATPAEAK
jgi:hypothetical protein